jgi:NAD(P)-dependent dehydrogenase (short-subunit alcohol dehydrogenase family)/aryl carrier-like protein
VQQQRIVEQVIGELRAKRPETVVAYRGKHRWVESFEQVRLTDDGKERGRLREEGVYLITGGLGGIGFMLAEYLVKTVRAKLVLVGRTALPEQDEFEPWQAGDSGEDEVSSKMMKVRALTELGAEVLVVSADVTDRQQMHAAVREAYERFGEIHGVIHAAGVAGGGVIQLKTEAAVASVLAPKVKGALVLEDIFKDTKLDFLVLCSSIVSVLSEFGQVDYCAANAFLDAFAHSTKSSTFTVSINWDIWREAGMGANMALPASLKKLYEEGIEEGILSAEGTDAFRRVLGCSSPQVIISVEDLQARIERHKVFAASSLLEELEKSDLPQPAYPRPELDNPYIAPTNGVEQIIADVWQRILGIKQVGIHDNFFELGGDSILSIQVVASVRRAGLHLTTQQLFEHQTISELARVADTSAAQVEQSPVASGIDNHPNQQAGRDRPQGFPRVNISQSELEALFGKTNSENIEDIYPLTPLQHGMLFHILAAPSSGMYVNQQRYTLQGSLDISALKTAFQQVIDRHQILRTAFILASHG